jgi:hypothetical protein
MNINRTEALRRADHPSKESYRLSLIKKLRKLSLMLRKREQAHKCGSYEEGEKRTVLKDVFPSFCSFVYFPFFALFILALSPFSIYFIFLLLILSFPCFSCLSCVYRYFFFTSSISFIPSSLSQLLFYIFFFLPFFIYLHICGLFIGAIFTHNFRLQWPFGLRHELCSLVRKLRSWVRIQLKAWMSACAFILCLYCPVCK